MYTLSTTNSKKKQTPTISNDAQYLILASEPTDTLTLLGRRARLGAYGHVMTKRFVLRRIRRELRASD